MLGSWVKQRIGTATPIASQPMRSTSASSICSSVMPWRGLRGWGRAIGDLYVDLHVFFQQVRGQAGYIGDCAERIQTFCGGELEELSHGLRER